MDERFVSYRRRTRAGFILLALAAALILAGCSLRAGGPGQIATGPAATPNAFPTLPVLPSRPPAVAAATAAPTPTPEPGPASVVAEPPAPTPAPTPDLSNPLLLPGVYVTAASVHLASAPGGSSVASAAGGTRLGLLGRTADAAWLQVLYQPDPGQPPISGWVRAASVTAFTDLAELVPAEAASAPAASAGSATTPAPASEETTATVLADRLNLRNGPGASEAVIGVLTRGQQVKALASSADGAWRQVQTTSGAQGWVAARYLQTDGQPAPVVRQSGASGQDHIVFQERSGGDIFIMNGDGSGLRRLTAGLDPALSPDGRQVAFTRWQEPRGLWLIGSDGSGERLLMGANRARSPAWSGDGGSIVYEQSAGGKVCRQSPFGCLTDDELRQQLGGDCIDTPFGRICIGDFPLSSLEFTTLVRIDLADGSTRNLPTSDSARAPVFQSGAQTVLYGDRDGLATTLPAGNDAPRRILTAILPLGAVSDSPDGRYIFGSQRDGDNWNIWRWTADGGQAMALTQPPAIRSAPVHNVAPTVSPDGRTVIFLSNRRGRWELWRMGPNGDNQQPFAPDRLSGLSFQYDFNQERVVDWGR